MGKNNIRKELSELLEKDFTELFETLQRLKVQSIINGTLPARATNMFSQLLGLNTWLQISCGNKESTSSTTSIFSGAIDNGLNWFKHPLKQTWCKSVKGQYLLLHPSSFSDVCQYTQT